VVKLFVTIPVSLLTLVAFFLLVLRSLQFVIASTISIVVHPVRVPMPTYLEAFLIPIVQFILLVELVLLQLLQNQLLQHQLLQLLQYQLHQYQRPPLVLPSLLAETAFSPVNRVVGVKVQINVLPVVLAQPQVVVSPSLHGLD